MAATDARPGFRLPWSGDQRTQSDDTAEATSAGDAPTADDAASDAAAPEATATDAAVTATSAPDAPATPAAVPATPARATAPKKPNKFLADLSKAMQAAAEAARQETLERFQADAKAFVEQIHSRSAEEAASLRQRADDDVAAIREWSKAEIARIREETDQKITTRKGNLEHEIEDHAALIELEIEHVQGRVTAFESEMQRFFERLLAEDDPTSMAEMAANLPEPPSFEDIDLEALAATVATRAAEPAPVAAVESPVASEPEPAVEAAPSEAQPEPAFEPVADPEAAFAAIQAAAEAAAIAEAADASGGDAGESAGPAQDARLEALGLSPDFEAAEAEAMAATDGAEDLEEIPTIADDALAARLAGLVGGSDTDAPTVHTTQVVVTGLVSVASIASFKRHIGRLPGVQSVGVSSGPDGEFVFAVAHGPEVTLAEVVPTLPGFQARVTSTSDGVVNATARDPESDS